MKPKDKERLARNRSNIVRSVDPAALLPAMVKAGAMTSQDVKDITSDPRKSQQVAKLLDFIEKKKSDVYDTFKEVLGDLYPHVMLQLTGEWEDDDFEDDPDTNSYLVGDEWEVVRRTRKFIANEIDAKELLPYLRQKEVIDDDDEDLIRHESDSSKRTEILLDLLQTKPYHNISAYDVLLEAIGESYPHIYLMLTDTDELNLDD